MKKTSKFLAALAAFFLFAPAPIDAKVTDGDSVAVLGAVVDDGNSTTDTLIADAVFTGTAYDVTDYSAITVFMTTDVDSADNGLSMEFSMDGTNWDRAKKISFLTANSASQVHSLAVIAKFFRVVYTNGSSAQTYFRMQTLYHPTKPRDLSSSATQIMNDQDDVTFVRVTSEHGLDVARGIHAGQSWVNVFGRNPTVGASEEAIHFSGGDYLGFLQTAQELEIVSGDADDNASGNGCRNVHIEYLDGNWAAQTTDVIPNGASAVATVTADDIIRVERMYCTSVGLCAEATPSTTCANEGDITLRKLSAGATIDVIPAGDGESEGAHYTIPMGSTGYLRAIVISVAQAGGNNTATVKLWQRRNVDDVASPFTPKRLILEHEDLVDVVIEEVFDYAISFPEQTDIWASAIRASGSGSVAVDVDMEILLVPNYALPPAP